MDRFNVKHQEQLRWCGAIKMPNLFLLLLLLLLHGDYPQHQTLQTHFTKPNKLVYIYKQLPTLESAETSPEIPPRASVRDAMNVPIETRLSGTLVSSWLVSHDGREIIDSL